MTTHPEIFCIPILMVIDYFLTVVGASLAERGYRNHFRFPDYELNPVFQKAIAAKRWFNPRHLLMVVITALMCIVWYQTWQDNDPIFEAALGAAFGVFATVVGGHLANIWTFHFMLKRPQETSGQVTLSQRYVLHLSRARMLMTLLPLAAVLCIEPSPFLGGVVAGVVALMLVLSIWMWRDTRKRRRQRQSTPSIDPAKMQ